MLTTKKNRFGHLLENLLYIAEIKNSSLAKALQYDVSYISKWINGRKLPAERNRKTDFERSKTSGIVIFHHGFFSD